MVRTSRALGPRLLSLLLAVVVAAPVAAASAPPPSRDDARPAAPAVGPRGQTRDGNKLVPRAKVNAAELARKPVKVRPKVEKPLLELPGGKAVSETPGPNAPAPGPLVAGPAPALAGLTANGPIVTGPATESIAFGTVNTQFQPPDPWIAVGPDHVVQAVNTAFKFMDRNNAAIQTVSLHDFFDLPDGFVSGTFDPRVIYDGFHGRWIATELSWDCEPVSGFADVGSGYVDVAISDTADPLGDWTLYSLWYPDEVPDYPMAGTSTDKVAIGSNVYSLVASSPVPGYPSCVPSAFLYSSIDVINFSELAAGGFVNWKTLPLTSNFTPRPAVQAPATSATIHAIAERSVASNLHVDYLRITGQITDTTDTIALSNTDLTAASQFGSFEAPPDPRQPTEATSSPNSIDSAVDRRPTDALWQNGRLFWVSTYPCTPAGDSEVRACGRVSELNTNATPTKVQDFLIGRNGFDVFHPGIGLSMNGAQHVTYTKSSLAQSPGTHAVYRVPGDTPNAVSAEESLRAGLAPYDIGERWGDYTGVAQDPQDPNVVWQTNEVTNASGEWVTHYSQLSTSFGTNYREITPVRVLDTRVGTGLSFRFNHRVARTWQVTGVLGIPAEALAVTGNVTVVGQNGAGHVSVTPRATNTPSSSTINFPLSDVRANNVTIPLGPGGTLSAVYIAQAGKATHLVFDVTGYFLADVTEATYNTIDPARMVDTRTGGTTARLARDVPKEFAITGLGSDIPTGAVAITANVTVTQQTASGHISVTPASSSNPPTSTINFPLGDNRANGQTIPLSPTGTIWAVYKASVAGARTHFIVDVTGYYFDDPAGLQYFPLNPGRRVDTRINLGLTGRLTANTGRTLETAGHLAVPTDAAAVTGNLTVTQPNKAGHLALTPDPATDPPTSTLNFPASDTRANGITQPINDADDMSIWFKSASGGTVHTILDITGYFR